MIGSTLAHYEILGKLGEGGMGIVYLAEDRRLRRKVALKMLPAGLADDPLRLARFEREVKTVAALNHPNIVTIYSVEEVDGRRFFTMEYLEGRTLSQLIPAGGMPLADFLKIAVPLAEALAAAHAKGVQHRDLKPSNVMVSPEGRVKVLDFGLAKLKESERTEAFEYKPETTLTQAGLAIGTLAYMAPEQLRMNPTDHRSDIFSLGVVLFEMASGRCPFLGQSTAEVISSILRDQPARVYEANENVPDELDTILRRCLEKEPSRRWSSAAELRDALAVIATEQALSNTAIRRARAPVPVPWTRRPKLLFAAGGAVALLAILALALVPRWRAPVKSGVPSPAAAVPVAAAAAVPSLAVLPLTSFSGEPEYFVDGITDALISSFARLRGVRVISRQSAMHYKGSTKLLPEIARELGVDYIVEGSVARVADGIRLNAQVVQADPETTLWSDSFERKATEVIALQNSFAEAIARAVHAQISPTEVTQMATTKSVDPAAYEAYLQGRYWAGKHGAENFRKAQGYFERAIAIDSTFAPAWSSLAEVHQLQGYFVDDLSPRLAQAETAVRRALALDPESASAHAALGDIHLGRWQWAEAEAEVRRALALEPNNASAHLEYWRLLLRLRRFDEGLREIQIALSLDPLSANITANFGFQLGLMKRYDQAFEQFRNALELDPDFTLVHSYAWFYEHQLQRDPQRARELRLWLLAEGFDDIVPDFDRRVAAEGYEAALHGLALRLDAMEKDPRARVGLVAGLLACAGEEDRAMRWLERGYASREWSLGWIAALPDFESLHDRADFRDLVRRVGLPEIRD